jgi:hypothetical protein
MYASLNSVGDPQCIVLDTLISVWFDIGIQRTLSLAGGIRFALPLFDTHPHRCHIESLSH